MVPLKLAFNAVEVVLMTDFISSQITFSPHTSYPHPTPRQP